MNIKAFKLTTGEEIIGEVSFVSETFTIKNPVGITFHRGADGKPGVGFAPFPIHAEQKTDATIDIHTQHVVYSYEPAKDYVDNYKEIFGSKLVLPNKTLITG